MINLEWHFTLTGKVSQGGSGKDQAAFCQRSPQELGNMGNLSVLQPLLRPFEGKMVGKEGKRSE